MTKLLALTLALVSAVFTGCGKALPRGPVPQSTSVKEIRVKLGGAEAPEAGTKSAAATGTGWARFAGVVKLIGDPPPRAALNVDKDQGICAPGGAKVLSNAVLVDSASKGIANVVLFARKASRVHPSAAAAPAAPAVFDQKACVFLTPVLGCRVDQKIVVKNSDNVLHNAKLEPQKNAGANFSVEGGGQAEYVAKVEEPVPIPVSCGVHPWMSAYIFPRGNNYFAVTKADGSFEIPDLPDGEELEFQIWHEGVKVWECNGADIKCSPKGQFKLKLEENKDKIVALEIPAKVFNK